MRVFDGDGLLEPVSSDAARATVGRWHRAGVTILAGTDANQAPSAPASPPYGTSLHHEQFGLADCGVIAPGKRADLVLIDGDPAQDISAVDQIAAVWCGGVPVANVAVADGAVTDVAARTEEAR